MRKKYLLIRIFIVILVLLMQACGGGLVGDVENSHPTQQAPSKAPEITVERDNDNQLIVNWEVQSDAQNYILLVSTSEDFDADNTSEIVVSKPPYVIPADSAQQQYFVKIKSNWSGNQSPDSNLESFTSPPITPTNLSSTVTDNNTIELSWETIEGVDSYTLYRHTSEIFDLGSAIVIQNAVSPYEDTTVEANQEYFYWLVAVTDAQLSAYSNVTSATVIVNIVVNQPPVFTSSSDISVNENSTMIITVEASDEENDGLTFSITGGADASHFTLDSNSGVLSFSEMPDFESPIDANTDNVYELSIDVSDAENNVEQILQITVLNVDEPSDSDSVAPITNVSPAGGVYNSAQSISLNCNDNGGAGCQDIYYTIDGSIPTSSSLVYSGPISITANTILQFFAIDNADNSESVKSETYTIDLDNPTTLPSSVGGSYNVPLSITLSCEDGSGTGCTNIYYTTDGSTPSVSSSIYSNPIVIPENTTTTLKYFATDAVNNSEPVKSETYTIDLENPTTLPSAVGGSYNVSLSITLSCEDGSGTGCTNIYYTTDGSTPSVSSSIYSNPIVIPENTTTTLKYFATDAVNNSEPVKSETYIIDLENPTTLPSAVGGSYNVPLSITLSCEDGSGTGCTNIYFTTDGSTPSESSNIYSNPIVIPENTTTTLKYFATDGANNSEVVNTETYRIDTIKPSVSITSPLLNATDVPLATNLISATFDEAMNGATVTASMFSLINSNAENVAGTFSFDSNSNTVTYALLDSLIDAELYTATLKMDVKDAVGNSMASDYSWSFTTANIAWIAENDTATFNTSIVKLSSANEELLKIDTINCSDLSGIFQYAIDQQDGGLWVSDTNNNRIFKLDETGELITLMDQNSSEGAAVDARDGSIWSSEYISAVGSRKLVKRSSLGSTIIETATGLSISHSDNAFSWLESDNSLWITSRSSQNLLKVIGSDTELSGYDLSGPSSTNHLRIGGFIGEAYAVSVYPASPPHIWASDRDGSIINFDLNGVDNFSRQPSGFFEVRDISTDITDGSVWMMDPNSGRIAKYSALGDSILNQGLNGTRTVEADPVDGGVWIGTSSGLLKMSATGQTDWKREAGNVSAIAVRIKPNQQAQNIHVSDAGDDTLGTGKKDSPYKTIRKGISVANSGDTIMVAAGTYEENITLKSSVKIIGADANTTTIQGDGSTDVVSGVGATNTILSQFTITNNSQGRDAGVYCADCQGVIIRRNIIRDNGVSTSTTSNGVELQGSSNVLVEQNMISGNSDGGLFISGTSQGIIRNNLIISNGDAGIYSGNGSFPSVIANNVIDSNGTESGGRSGIMIFSNDLIQNNIISNNGTNNPNAGLSVGIYAGSSAAPVLSYNNVFNNFQAEYTNVAPGTGDISVDPEFVGTSDFHLKTNSPSINTGDPGLTDAAVECSSFTDRRSDMGAYGGPWGNW